MLLIYTHKITPRFSYVMKQMFTRILGIQVFFTTKVEDFIKHTGPKITYTKQPLQNEFFVRSNDLLFEQGINDFQVNVLDWEGIPCFFKAGERSNIPFDIFSASFYLLSRYEEYLPHLKDIHGRFPAKESLAFQQGFLKTPIVDMWAFKLLECLKERFPDIENNQRKYKHVSVIDVTTSHSYAYRGLIRNMAGFLLDLGTLRIKRLVKRIQVWVNPENDPYNNFGWLIKMHKKYDAKSMFFFQFAEYSTYDKNVSPNNNKFKFLIKSIADYSIVSLSASYSSFDDNTLLRKEKKRLANVINRSVNYSRMRYNRINVPFTYRNLMEAEFTDDYSMGYTHEIGFRAGTCTPFYFYDILLEVQQPIRIHPFAIHDYALISLKSKNEIIENVDLLYRLVREVNGELVTIFSNELLGENNKVDWKDLYCSILSRFNV